MRRPATRTIESIMAASHDPASGDPDLTNESSFVDLNFCDDFTSNNGDSLLSLACSAGVCIYISKKRRP